MIGSSHGQVEMITVRLNYGNTERFLEILRHVAEGVRMEKCQARSVSFLQNGQTPGDWAILMHYPAMQDGGKSPLAIHLAEALRSVGLVNHTVWIPCTVDGIAVEPGSAMETKMRKY